MQDIIEGPVHGAAPQDRGRVLLLEDDPLLAKCFGQLLVTLGVADVAIAHTNAAAIDIIEGSGIVAAFVDVSLGLETSAKTAHALTRRGIPFAFVSGRPPSDALTRSFPQALSLTKPARKARIEEVLGLLEYRKP